ncbi:hypothetical protein PsYK624_171220 [Phanerochaete sordida]|uniref:Uncharacterized protein n=1 Tax=Phanerochaete sordida TaxID=48140 RepID=A0A9P3GYX2_9APHY|nr:hypothetical protein PsYK624_171220 [Phanerochaete sordida]
MPHVLQRPRHSPGVAFSPSCPTFPRLRCAAVPRRSFACVHAHAVRSLLCVVRCAASRFEHAARRERDVRPRGGCRPRCTAAL